MSNKRFQIHHLGQNETWLLGIEVDTSCKDIAVFVGKYGISIRYGR